ncbi:MAG: FkbM family methyltransferase [Bacteroidia bacterium]
MDFNYTKIKLGNWLYKNCFPLYNISYTRFKLKNDKDEIAVLRRLIKPGDHVLDIGANIGFYAKLLSGMTGENGKVYCFEPDALNFKHLRKNVSSLKNVAIFPSAVSEKNETLKIYRSKLLNVDHRTYAVNNYDSVEEIPAVSIDSLLKAGTIEKADLIKIDIQGYELTAFKGMLQLLKTASPPIVAEYWPHGFKRAGTSAVEFFDFFNAFGYKLFKIDGAQLNILSRDYIAAHNDEPFEFSFNILITKN